MSAADDHASLGFASPIAPLFPGQASFTGNSRHVSRHRPAITMTAAAPVPSSGNMPAAAAPSSKMADAFDAIPPQLRSSMLALPEDADIAELGKRHSKIVATIGPATSSYAELLRLAAGGVNLARLNMCHGDFEWHSKVIKAIREINRSSPFVVGIMVDLGSLDTVRLGEFSQPPVLAKGDLFTLTSRHEAEYPKNVSEVSSDAFLNVATIGDLLQIQADGNSQVEMLVSDVTETDVICKVTTDGALRSRGSITIRGKSLNVNPGQLEEDLNVSIARAVLGCPPDQLEFAVRERVEYIALSFVESPDQILSVRRLLRDRGANIGVIAKIESADALKNLEDITAAADGVMVARGDLGTAIHYAKVPYWQDMIVQTCLRHGKPSLISTHFLESMVLYPTPTRAEVTDMTEAVKQRADALVLTSETASGRFPFKAVQTMDAVLRRSEQKHHERDPLDAIKEIPPIVPNPSWWTQASEIAENIASAAAVLANERGAKAILSFTQKGLSASLVSRYRPNAPIYAFTATPTVRNKLSLVYGVRPFRIAFSDEPEETIQAALAILKARKAVEGGDLVVILADILGGRAQANEEEISRVFKDIAQGGRFITASQVRRALRQLGLKVSDKTEADLGMREVDVMDTGLETNLTSGSNNSLTPSMSTQRFDFERFSGFARAARETVHTIQCRVVPSD
jgi:pyruvate kinase